ncbi:MAG: hypothetical protein Q7R70_03030 [Candidatus Diapherotrites archaeon]|nr:hypothetical protein [Candidatus Diapherotrites archaeon]
MKEKILNLNITKDFLTTIGGQNAPEVVKVCLEKNKDITDEEISKKIPLKITEIRTILNQLHYRGIACYNKAKTKRSGWYNYTWTIKTKRIAELLLEQKAEEINRMEKRQELEKNYEQFACPGKCTQMAFEIAAEYQFKCPECGKQMNIIDNRKIARESKQKIESIKREVNVLKKVV